MHNQRSYKIGRSFASNPDHPNLSDLVMRRSLRGFDMSEGKSRARPFDSNNNNRNHKSMVGSRITQTYSASRRLKTETSKAKQDPKPAGPESTEQPKDPDQRTLERLNRYFVVRPHNSFVLQRPSNNPLKKRVALPPIAVSSLIS